jgi:hypothetical protein
VTQRNIPEKLIFISTSAITLILVRFANLYFSRDVTWKKKSSKMRRNDYLTHQGKNINACRIWKSEGRDHFDDLD